MNIWLSTYQPRFLAFSKLSQITKHEIQIWIFYLQVALISSTSTSSSSTTTLVSSSTSASGLFLPQDSIFTKNQPQY
jgi:hypothetical protein